VAKRVARGFSATEAVKMVEEAEKSEETVEEETE